jgi:hypothetical protein
MVHVHATILSGKKAQEETHRRTSIERTPTSSWRETEQKNVSKTKSCCILWASSCFFLSSETEKRCCDCDAVNGQARLCRLSINNDL